jgi:hypothetical protein
MAKLMIGKIMFKPTKIKMIIQYIYIYIMAKPSKNLK